MSGRIYSIGYEGLEAQSLAERLAQLRVAVLVDVRLNAISRKPGFSRRALAAALSSVGIEYLHERELGNPQDNRTAFRRGDGTEGRRRMRTILSNGSRPAVARLAALAKHKRVAVMCVERDRLRCHRDVVTEMVQEIDPSIEVLHTL